MKYPSELWEQRKGLETIFGMKILGQYRDEEFDIMHSFETVMFGNDGMDLTTDGQVSLPRRASHERNGCRKGNRLLSANDNFLWTNVCKQFSSMPLISKNSKG